MTASVRFATAALASLLFSACGGGTTMDMSAGGGDMASGATVDLSMSMTGDMANAGTGDMAMQGQVDMTMVIAPDMAMSGDGPIVITDMAMMLNKDAPGDAGDFMYQGFGDMLPPLEVNGMLTCVGVIDCYARMCPGQQQCPVCDAKAKNMQYVLDARADIACTSPGMMGQCMNPCNMGAVQCVNCLYGACAQNVCMGGPCSAQHTTCLKDNGQ